MKPAWSVVVFTVLSGAGFGALALLGLGDVAGRIIGTALIDAGVLWRASTLALALVIAGLIASTLHLGNPRNAWRSLSRLRTSWLSREALASIALLAIASLWITALFRDGAVAVRGLLAAAVVVLALAALYCTAMIYASLKPVRQWCTARVPLAYLTLGLASGALLVVAILRADGHDQAWPAIGAACLLVIAAGVKLEYYAFIASDVRAITLEEAIGVQHGVAPAGTLNTRMRARLFDVGHSRGTFLTREFVHALTLQNRMRLRLLVWFAGFGVPLVWLASGVRSWPIAVFCVTACLIGVGAERWLFFAEARHTVRLYHGDRST